MFSTTIERMIIELESGMFGVTATERTLHPKWHKWYQLTDFEIDNYPSWTDTFQLQISPTLV